MSDLPEEIMVEIMMRLPFESILAFKCVSKHWNRVASDPDFLTRYSVDKSATFPATDDPHCLFLVTNITADPCNDNEPSSFKVRRVPPLPVGTPIAVRDGVACYYRSRGASGGQFRFYNLLTGASRTIENAPTLKYSCWPWLFYGFGYDSGDDDYKMMGVFKDSARTGVFWVYSSNEGNWVRRVGFPRADYEEYPSWSMACTSNNKLHWVVYVGDEKSKVAILTYDWRTCEFGEIAVPSEKVYRVNLKALGGWLCYWNDTLLSIDMWVMQENSWTMLLKMDRLMLDTIGRWRELVPVTLHESRDGRKLVIFVNCSDRSLYWYDMGNGEVVKIVQQTSWRKARVVVLREPEA